MYSNAHINIDSITKYDEYIDKAKEYGMKAFAFAEHGNIFGWEKKKQGINDAGMKYIHAIEAYLTEDELGCKERHRDNYHCVLIARNIDGVEEINNLVSDSNEEDHSYYTPRLTFKELYNTSDNIIITTACIAGPLSKGNKELQCQFLKWLIKHKDRCFLEIQHHNVENQKVYNRKLYKISQKTGLRLIAGTDSHALNEEQLDGRRELQLGKDVAYALDEKGWDMVFKSYDELVKAYELQDALPREVYLKAIDNTNVMADMVTDWEFDRKYKYPHLWEDSEGFFKKRIAEGVKWRGVNKYPNFNEYINRINEEYAVYKQNGAIDFMLLMDDIIQWCKKHDIQTGYGRGSVNGSVIAYLLGITEMDSVKFNLNFSRFMNPERVSLADIDTDIPPSKIPEVKEYINSKEGLYCCDIVTFNTIADKGAIKDIGRAMNMSVQETQDIADTVDDEKTYKISREKYPELFRYVDMVKGCIVSIGSHPSGFIVSPIDVRKSFGTARTKTDEYPISQINMKELDALNYVKLDLLKLDTIEIITDTCKKANIPMLLPDNIDVNDTAVWNSIRDDTTAIFQWEGSSGPSYIKRLLSDKNIEAFKKVDKNVDRMTLLSIGNSALRPAGASYRDDLASGVVRKTGSKPIDNFLKPTFGYLVFQCQIIDFLHLYCGFTMGEADVVRRCFSKKLGTDQWLPIIKNGGYSLKNKDHYIKGYIQTMKEMYGISEEKSEQDITAFLQVIDDASSYLFSKNHSQPYSYMGYAEGWLRYYYPLEFLTSALNIAKGKEEKIAALTSYGKKFGISIKGIKFGYSRDKYYFDKTHNYIYKGIASIKHCNAKIANELYDLSKTHFNSFIDLLYSIKENTSVNKTQIKALITLNFFSDFGKNKKLLTVYAIYKKLGNRKTLKKNELNKYGIPESVAKRISGKETAKQFSQVDSRKLVEYLSTKVKEQPLSIIDQLKGEKEFLGYCESTWPKIEDDYYYVTQVKGNTERPYVYLRCLHNGSEKTVHVKKGFKYNPIKEDSIIIADDFSYEHKWKYIGGDFVRLDAMEETMKNYEVIRY